jgi:phosphoheptose isomerase
MPYKSLDLSLVRTYSLRDRPSLVALSDLVAPGSSLQSFSSTEMDEVAQRIIAARQSGAPVVCFIGGHVVKRGLAPVLIDLMARGAITHLASNGAAAIHDFEIALQGYTSEDVARSLEDGSFGMAEETGAWMNSAARAGARDGIGLGEALGRMIAAAELFPYKIHSLLCNAYQLGIPYTVHVAIGTDIIHQHPLVDFAALGWSSGQDFKVFAHAVSQLEGGAFLNFGSAVLGPEVFLKALSVARNLTGGPHALTTANFDLLPLSGDYRTPSKDSQPEYYYRPKKNIVIRPTSLGGKGFHITGDHRATLPNLAAVVCAGLPSLPVQSQRNDDPVSLSPEYETIWEHTLQKWPVLTPVTTSLRQAFRLLTLTFTSGGTLYLCGNGGSFADALHIAGELVKPFLRPRPLLAAHASRLAELAPHLHRGLRVVVLGNNPSLASAIDNDTPIRHLGFAQELYALARPGDALLAISTSGNAQPVLNAVRVARALGLAVVALTGQNGGKLAPLADAALLAPGVSTPAVQDLHTPIYHALCEMLEAWLVNQSV